VTINEVYRKGEIEVRSFNICINAGLNSLEDLKIFFKKNGTFKKLRNCGNKSNKELIAICYKYQLLDSDQLLTHGNTNAVDLNALQITTDNFLKAVKDGVITEEEYAKTIEEKDEEKILEIIIFELTNIQREVINSFILLNTKSLSNRVTKVLSYQLEDNFKIKNFAEKILLNPKIINTWKNIGAKSIPEVGTYLLVIKNFIFEVIRTNENQLIALKKNLLIRRTFSISHIPNNILETESIFLFIKFLLKQNALFNKTKTALIKKAFKIYQNQKELTLDVIADDLNLTYERIRQIRKICLEELFDKLLFITNFNDHLFHKYCINVESMYIEINTNILNKINQSNNTNFSREFITFILSAYLNDSFSLVGNYEDVLQPKYFHARNRHNWKNFYLIEKELSLEFDFISFTNDISNRVSDRIEESYYFNFKSYLSKFLSKNNIDVLDLLFPICEKIINEEFELHLDLDENLIFIRKTKRQVHEYAYEALESLGKSSKVKEIFEKVIELHPNYDTAEERIRASMNRANGFVPIGRKSVFGLKKWEKELDDYRGGTIRDIVEEYLMQFPKPKHISDITEYVKKYRPKTYKRSIWDNLKGDKSGLYIFFRDSHIGLTTKKYDSDFKKTLKVKKGDKETWEELTKFVLNNHRPPSSIKKGEEYLYRFLYKQRKLFDENELDSNEEIKFIEVAKILQNIKYENKRN